MHTENIITGADFINRINIRSKTIARLKVQSFAQNSSFGGSFGGIADTETDFESCCAHSPNFVSRGNSLEDAAIPVRELSFG